jgi:hypothetical protein
VLDRNLAAYVHPIQTAGSGGGQQVGFRVDGLGFRASPLGGLVWVRAVKR